MLITSPTQVAWAIELFPLIDLWKLLVSLYSHARWISYYWRTNHIAIQIRPKPLNRTETRAFPTLWVLQHIDKHSLVFGPIYTLLAFPHLELCCSTITQRSGAFSPPLRCLMLEGEFILTFKIIAGTVAFPYFWSNHFFLYICNEFFLQPLYLF